MVPIEKKRCCAFFFCQENKNINGFEYVCIGGIKQPLQRLTDAAGDTYYIT